MNIYSRITFVTAFVLIALSLALVATDNSTKGIYVLLFGWFMLWLVREAALH